MNERIPVEFSVSEIIFRRTEATYTARVEITWGIQAAPYIFSQVMYGTESAEYLAAQEGLPDEEFREAYPNSITAPGFAFTASAVCQITPTIYVTSGLDHGEVYSGYVSVRPVGGDVHQWDSGVWVAVEAGMWQQGIPAVAIDPDSNVSGGLAYRSFPLFIGDPNDSCGTDDPGTGTGSGTGTTPTPSGQGGNMGTTSGAPSTTDDILPGCVTLTEWTCPETTETEATTCDQLCRNPLYAIDHEDECDAVPTLSQVRLEPSPVRAAVGRRGAYRVVAVFSNGQQADVTSEATAVISDSSVATVLSKGVVKGVAAGTATVTVAWEGRTATGTIQTFASECASDDTWDVVLVLDQAVASFWFASRASAPGCGVYWRRSVGASDYVAEYAGIATALALGMSLKNPWDSDAGADRLSIIATGNGSPRVTTTWTDTLPVVSSLNQATTDSRLGESLRMARSLLNSARSGAKKLVVLFTAGSESVCAPNARTAATELTDSGAYVAVVTPLHSGLPWTVFSPCTYPEDAQTYLESIATEGLYFSDPTGLDALGLLAGIESAYCATEA